MSERSELPKVHATAAKKEKIRQILLIVLGFMSFVVFSKLLELGLDGWGSPDIVIDAIASAIVVSSFVCGCALLSTGIEGLWKKSGDLE